VLFAANLQSGIFYTSFILPPMRRPMTPAQDALVRTSFAKIVPFADTAATIFYDELFALDPPLRRLFKDDMTEQRQKLMQMLSIAVAHLGDLGAIAPAVRALGQRHIGYGVTPTDYQTVGTALITTLEKGLGDDFTPDVRAAWEACIAAIATQMLEPTSV